MKEVWKDILEYEGLYQVSNLGRVRSLDRIVYSHIKGKPYQKMFNGKIMSPANNGIGYYQVGFTNNGKTSKKYVHVLVAEHFLEKPNDFEYFEVNHIDHNKSNNTLTNLEYVTKSQNILKSADFYGRVEYKCKDCGNNLSDGKATRCLSCNSINSRKVKNRPTVEQLLELLASNSFIKVGKMYGVSDNTIRSWLK